MNISKAVYGIEHHFVRLQGTMKLIGRNKQNDRMRAHYNQGISMDTEITTPFVQCASYYNKQ